MVHSIAFIGFGEAGLAFAKDGARRGDAAAYDINPDRAAYMAGANIHAAETAAALGDSDAILSLVTADQALIAAREYCPVLKDGALWIDMNSVAPDTKRAAADAAQRCGAFYVDAAVLAPVYPAQMAVPILLSGAAAEQARDALIQFGFSNIRVVGVDVGRASAIKMIRSVMVKGIEALTDEMMAAADAAGVTDEVLASLDASEKRESWAVRAPYNLERMSTHGLRRAAEMEEAASTLGALGVDPVMTRGTIRRQRGAASPIAKKRSAA